MCGRTSLGIFRKMTYTFFVRKAIKQPEGTNEINAAGGLSIGWGEDAHAAWQKSLYALDLIKTS